MNSKECFERACTLIPGGVSSPVRAFRHVGLSPVYFAKGDGASLTDVEGKHYIDFCLSFGPHILGHSPAPVVKAVQEQAANAMSFGACHPGEIQLAELILRGYPFLDRVRLVNSGTEAVMTAIRLARGFSGRNKIVKFEGCYHGHSDGLLAKSGSSVAELSESSSRGVPESIVQDTLIARFDDFPGLENLFSRHQGQIAALILEPIPANYGLSVPKKELIHGMAQLAREHGALVIFDEVITGFRIGLSGACGYYDVKPDLVTLGKVIGGGLPLAAVAGRRDIMEGVAPMGEVYQAGTLSGNPLATAAGTAVLTELFRDPPYAGFEFGCTAFIEGLREILEPTGPVFLPHVGSIFCIYFGEAPKTFPPEMPKSSSDRFRGFFQKALEAGIYFPPSPYEVSFLSTSHTPDVLGAALEKLKRCNV